MVMRLTTIVNGKFSDRPFGRAGRDEELGTFLPFMYLDGEFDCVPSGWKITHLVAFDSLRA